MPSPARRTLFWKYAAYFSGLVSALLILSGGLGGYFAYRESAAALEALQSAKAQVAASEIASFIGRLVDDLQSVTTKFSTTGAVDEEDLRVELVALLRYQPSITELNWIAADGREVRAFADSTRRHQQRPKLVGRSAVRGYAPKSAIHRVGVFSRRDRTLFVARGDP